MRRQHFPRAARLLASDDFKQVFDQASFRASHRHGLLLARSNEKSASRLGLVVAKKHVRRAVQRNEIKRLVREQFRTHTLTVPCDLVFLVRAGAQQLNRQELHRMVETLWAKLEKQLCES